MGIAMEADNGVGVLVAALRVQGQGVWKELAGPVVYKATVLLP